MARYSPFPLDTNNRFSNSPGLANVDLAAAQGMVDSEAVEMFKLRLSRLKDAEREKDKLVEELLQRLEMTEGEYSRLRLDHEREIGYNREQQKRETQLQKQLRSVRSVTDSNAFVVVLLDGDGMIFNDDQLQQGERGGKEAASHLWSAMNHFIGQELPHLSSPSIIARVYANVRGLGDVLQKCGIIDRATLFEDFVRGFNGNKLLFDFIDVGTGKDKADDKITEIFKLYLRDIHCHHLVFGCSHDNGYARLLEDNMADTMIVRRITLLEGVPFERELAALQQVFKITKFDDLFRTTKLAPSHQVRTAPTSNWQRPLQPISTNVLASPPSQQYVYDGITDQAVSSITTASPVPTWASMTAAPAIAPEFSPATRGTSQPGTGPGNPGPTISRNRHGQRIDTLDDTIPNEEIRRMKKLKLCNLFYLSGEDACTNPRCTHDHEYPISVYELKTLRQVARMAPCNYRTECDDPACIYGHRCPQSLPNSKDCWFKSDCRFAGWGHAIDTKICKTIKV